MRKIRYQRRNDRQDEQHSAKKPGAGESCSDGVGHLFHGCLVVACVSGRHEARAGNPDGSVTINFGADASALN